MSNLADYLKERGFLKNSLLYNAFSIVDRKDFVPEDYKDYAYEDTPLPIGYDQTISQPQVVAFMIDLLDLKEDHRVLDIGFGSGWATALLAETVKKGKVIGIEKNPDVYKKGVSNLEKYNYFKEDRVEVFLGDGRDGCSEKGPFDRVLVSAADTGFDFPKKIKPQLKKDGKIVIPINSSIFVFTKKEKDFEKKEYPGFSFVPLT